MADVFSQLYVQTVFAVKNRNALIQPRWETELHKYITGIIENRGHKMLAIGGMPDHIHLFFGLNPAESISTLVAETKKSSNTFIKERRLSPFKFEWQAGYGAFSYSRSHMDGVCKYTMNQKEHHKTRTFESEFLKMVSDFGIEIGQKKPFDFFIPDAE
jgi:putative transposase